jgi:hypothetical protein
MPTNTGPVLLVDVFCSQCGGCGNGDPAHRGCKPSAHVDYEGFDQDDEDDQDDDAQDYGPACPSCNGRLWNAVTGFNGVSGYAVEGVTVLRVPCGCASPRMVTGPDPATLAPYPEQEWSPSEAGAAVAAALDQVGPGPWSAPDYPPDSESGV